MKNLVTLSEVPVGKTFTVWNRKFTVLKSEEDKVFVLAAELEAQIPFREDGGVCNVAPNDFRDSTIRNWLNDEYLRQLQKDGLKNGDILDLEIDLWYVRTSGDYYGNHAYRNTYGVRPALNLSPSLLVHEVENEEVESK